MTIYNYKPQLNQNEILIYVPCKYAFDGVWDELNIHLLHLGFDVKIEPTKDDNVTITIHQSTLSRMALLGAIAYYKIKGVNYAFAIEQDNDSLFINPNIFA